jgi:hypothetical protein
MPESEPSLHPGQSLWDENDWNALLWAIKYKECTPFLGAGACSGVLPSGGDLAAEWAREFNYPFHDPRNLIRVSQFVAIRAGPKTPRFKIRRKFSGAKPDFDNPDEPHRVLAELRLPVYITTNYDDFMWQALERVLANETPRGHARREVCKWHHARRRQKASEQGDIDATPEGPVIYHLHGTLDDVDSMVLTEDDYLDFLMCISEAEQKLIPPRIERAFSDSALLFMGYSLEDMNFKVLFRRLAGYMQRNEGARHVAVQLKPQPKESTADQIERARDQQSYLERHFDLQRVKIYWGECHKFTKELRERWNAFPK